MKKFLRLLMVLSSLFILAFPVQEVASMEVPFSVEPVIPDNQASGVSYFDLAMQSGQEQDLEVILTNSSDQPIEIVVKAHSGVTNANGVIVYDGSLPTVKSYDSIIFDEMVKIENDRVTVPANGEAKAVIHVKAPEDNFDGLILGGLHFLLEAPENDENSGVSIQNQYAYVIGVNIREEGNTTKVEADLEVDKIEAEEVYGQPGVVVYLSNLAPAIISNADVLAEIFPANQLDTPVAKREASMFSVAPSLAFNFPIELTEGEELAEGDYVLKISLKSNKYDILLEEAFSIPAN